MSETYLHGMTPETSVAMHHRTLGYVDVIATYKHTCTIRCEGRGLSEGKRLTIRGVSRNSLFPLRVRSDEANSK